MKIGVIGGTFDPIHLGHIAIAEAAFNEYKLDRLWFMPAGDPYFKEGNGVSSPSVRLEMTKICVDALSGNYEVSDIEVLDQSRTYSANTFRTLKEEYPEDSFYFIMGLDSLQNLDKWYRPEILLKYATILCAFRRDDSASEDIYKLIDSLNEKYSSSNPDIRVIHAPEICISSTMIRNAVYQGKDISRYVTPEVADYIKKHGLYKYRNSDSLSDSRHTYEESKKNIVI